MMTRLRDLFIVDPLPPSALPIYDMPDGKVVMLRDGVPVVREGGARIHLPAHRPTILDAEIVWLLNCVYENATGDEKPHAHWKWLTNDADLHKRVGSLYGTSEQDVIYVPELNGTMKMPDPEFFGVIYERGGDIGDVFEEGMFAIVENVVRVENIPTNDNKPLPLPG